MLKIANLSHTYPNGRRALDSVNLEAPPGSFDIGVFTAEPGKKNFTEDSVLSLQKQQVRSGKPTFVGFDPYNKYVDRDSEDNVLKVSEAEAAA